MRKVIAITILLSACVCTQAQERNWRMTPLPVISYRSDLGLQLGAVAELSDTLTNRIKMDATYFTKGQSMVNVQYDTRSLIPGVHLNAGLRINASPYYSFYGFGGDASDYDPGIDRKNGKAYYSYDQSMVQLLCTLEKPISHRLSWTGGISYRYFKTGEIGEGDYDPDFTLYGFYRKTGIIRDNETKGSVLELKAGLIYDSRNSVYDPSSGIKAEMSLVGSPKIGSYGYIKLIAQLKGFVSPGADWITLAGNLAYQGTVTGATPFFIQEHIYSRDAGETVTRGLGGMNTIRGLLTGRMIGDGYLWSNIEARLKIIGWDMGGSEWYVGLNPFFDMGMITKPSRLEETASASGMSPDTLRRLATRLHKSIGIGLKFSLGGANIISIEYARALDKQVTTGSILVGTGYIF